MARANRNRFDEQNTEILRGIDVAAEYRALGVEITGRRPNQKHWIECWAIDRPHGDSPSAAVNVITGRYIDKGGEGLSLSLWDFAESFGPYATWQEARKHYADKAGIKLSRGRTPKSSHADLAKQLAFSKWNDTLVQLWIRHKPGCTLEAFRAAGGQLAGYPAKSKQFKVAVLPVYGLKLLESDPVGYVAWNTNGQTLPVWDRKQKGKIKDWVKMKSIYGSEAGLMGRHAVARLSTDQSAGSRPDEPIWLVAGPTDMMALFAIIPPDLRDTHLVVCNSGGETETPSDSIIALFAGRTVYLVRDCDTPGELGAAVWLQALAPGAAEIRHVKLPFEIKPNKGADLRDFIAKGRTYDDLLELAQSCEPFTLNSPVDQPQAGDTDADTTDPDAAPESASSASPPTNGFADRKILEALSLDVFGEHGNGDAVVFASHGSRRKLDVVKMPDRISYARLLQLAGPPVKELVAEGSLESEDNLNKIPLSQVRNAICYFAGANRLGPQSLSASGCWRSLTPDQHPTPGVILVGSREAAEFKVTKPTAPNQRFRTTFQKITHARIGGRLLDFGLAHSWYDFDGLSAHLKSASNPKWVDSVIQSALTLFQQWRWQFTDRQPTLCPSLVTGLVLASWVQTLWAWRPQIALIGATQTGKSILCETLGGLFGSLAIRSSKSSAAGLRQAIQTSGRVAIVDEFEDSKHRDEILEMARASSRGDKILRGTADHHGQEFVIQHIFWFAAIELGLKRAPDRNRYTILELLPPLEENRGKLALAPTEELHDLGQRLLAIAVRYVLPAREMAVRLKALPHPDADTRIIESLAVPASIIATAYGWSDDKADRLLAQFLQIVDPADHHASDQEDLMSALLAAVIRLDGGRDERTVCEIIRERDLDRLESLERCGIALVHNRPGSRLLSGSKDENVARRSNFSIFIDPRIATDKLLNNTRWRNQSIDVILGRLPDAHRTRRRIAGGRSYGILIPMDSIRPLVYGDEGAEGDDFGPVEDEFFGEQEGTQEGPQKNTPTQQKNQQKNQQEIQREIQQEIQQPNGDSGDRDAYAW